MVIASDGLDRPGHLSMLKDRQVHKIWRLQCRNKFAYDSMRDIYDLVQGKVLYKEKTGQARGTGLTFTAGENPVEICLTDADRAPLHKQLFRSNVTD